MGHQQRGRGRPCTEHGRGLCKRHAGGADRGLGARPWRGQRICQGIPGGCECIDRRCGQRGAGLCGDLRRHRHRCRTGRGRGSGRSAFEAGDLCDRLAERPDRRRVRCAGRCRGHGAGRDEQAARVQGERSGCRCAGAGDGGTAGAAGGSSLTVAVRRCRSRNGAPSGREPFPEE